MVLQKNHIFQGSIFENIRYGKTDASLEDVILAAQKASIHEQILQLPQAYDADALMLSGGQQQRIALARMFLKNPPIIFLDEPTASLDAIATEQIKQSLDEIKQGRRKKPIVNQKVLQSEALFNIFNDASRCLRLFQIWPCRF